MCICDAGLLDGAQDFVTVDQSLLTNAGLVMNRTRDIVNQEEVKLLADSWMQSSFQCLL